MSRLMQMSLFFCDRLNIMARREVLHLRDTKQHLVKLEASTLMVVSPMGHTHTKEWALLQGFMALLRKGLLMDMFTMQ